jgi:3'-5' exonuclease
MLKRNIPERVWIFDMEWVPDAAAARRLYDMAEETTEREAIERLWKENGATDARPQPFLKYLFSRIVSIAFLSRRIVFRDGEQQVEFAMHSLPKLPVDPAEADESHIIDKFLHYLGERRPQLVGYNSQESDLQVLIQRGLVNEVAAPMFCKRPENKWDPGDYFLRWDNEEHLDLMKLFSGRTGMTPKLDEIAKLCGFPGKLDIDGMHVVDLWLAGDLTKIVEYNQIDTLNTYLLWLRVVYFCGKLKEEEYVAEVDAFRAFLETEAQKPEKKFVIDFLNKWEI